jgi:GNAT superfamily N-acetyltransferase
MTSVYGTIRLMTDTRVRPAQPSDASTIVEFVRGLAAFEHEPLEQVHLTEADVLRDGFGDRPSFECVIAEHGPVEAPRAVGFALFFPNYSTWEGRAGIYVEDIFVVEDARRTGAGRAILEALARIAHDRGAPRIDLAVLDWNPACGFYERLGFRQQSEWLPYRLEADGIAALACE